MRLFRETIFITSQSLICLCKAAVCGMLGKECCRDQPRAGCRSFVIAPVDRSSGVSPDLYSGGVLSNLSWDTYYPAFTREVPFRISVGTPTILSGTFHGVFPVPLGKFGLVLGNSPRPASSIPFPIQSLSSSNASY